MLGASVSCAYQAGSSWRDQGVDTKQGSVRGGPLPGRKGARLRDCCGPPPRLAALQPLAVHVCCLPGQRSLQMLLAGSHPFEALVLCMQRGWGRSTQSAPVSERCRALPVPLLHAPRLCARCRRHGCGPLRADEGEAGGRRRRAQSSRQNLSGAATRPPTKLCFKAVRLQRHLGCLRMV